MATGKIEGLITIPSTDWEFELTDSGGPFSITLTAADTYYHSSIGNDSVDLPAKLKALMDAASSETYTVSIGSDGKYTISVASGTFSISWTDTAIRDLLGFDADISSESSATGADQAQGLWLPQCPVETPYSLNTVGLPVSSATIQVAPDGTITALHGPKYRKNSLNWLAITKNKAWAAEEDTTNESYEQFWLDVIRGEASFATSGLIRWYRDSTDDATYVSYKVSDATSPQMERLDARYDGLWSVSLQVIA